MFDLGVYGPIYNAPSAGGCQRAWQATRTYILLFLHESWTFTVVIFLQFKFSCQLQFTIIIADEKVLFNLLWRWQWQQYLHLWKGYSGTFTNKNKPLHSHFHSLHLLLVVFGKCSHLLFLKCFLQNMWCIKIKGLCVLSLFCMIHVKQQSPKAKKLTPLFFTSFSICSQWVQYFTP